MNKLYLKYIYLVPVYVLLQVLILNQIQLSAYINPFLYLLLIIGLPIKTKKWFLLTYAFFLGLIIDAFSSSLGFHSTACVLIAFIKPIISKITIPNNILGETDNITIQKIGNKSYITFSLLLIIIHHACIFIIEHLDFNIIILIKIFLNSLITLILIIITQFLIWERK